MGCLLLNHIFFFTLQLHVSLRLFVAFQVAQITIAQGKKSVMRQSVSLYILAAALFGRTREGRGDGGVSHSR